MIRNQELNQGLKQESRKELRWIQVLDNLFYTLPETNIAHENPQFS